MTPAEVIAAATCSGPRFGGGPAPCEVCRGRAERDVAALVEHGYAITPAPREGQFVVRTMTSWVPYSPELVAEMTGRDVDELRDLYGHTVLVRMGFGGPEELKRGGAEPSPAEVRETAAILRQATGSGTAPQPPGTTQGAFEGSPGVSGRSDDPKAVEGLSALRRAEEAEEALEAAQQALSRVLQHARDLNDDALAAVLLNLNPADLRPGAALAALTEEPRAAL